MLVTWVFLALPLTYLPLYVSVYIRMTCIRCRVFFLLTGSIGFVSCLTFVNKIYSAIK